MICILCSKAMDQEEFVILNPALNQNDFPDFFRCECGAIYSGGSKPDSRMFDGQTIKTENPIWIIDRKVYTVEEAMRVSKLKAFL